MSARNTIAIIATSGDAPLNLAHRIQGEGYTPLIVILEHITTADFTDFETITHPIGAIGHMIRDLKARDCHQLIFSGHLKRPPLAQIKPDVVGLKILSKVVGKGDDQALTIIKDAFADAGISILDLATLMPETYAAHGMICGEAADAAIWASIGHGAGLLRATSPFDLGQSCIVQDERILAVEGVEGTNALIMRASQLISTDLGKPVFVKMMKTGQDPSLDPPGFGLETIRHCIDAGIKTIALEAGRVVIFDKDAVITMARENNLTIIGFDQSEVSDNG